MRHNFHHCSNVCIIFLDTTRQALQGADNVLHSVMFHNKITNWMCPIHEPSVWFGGVPYKELVSLLVHTQISYIFHHYQTWKNAFTGKCAWLLDTTGRTLRVLEIHYYMFLLSSWLNFVCSNWNTVPPFFVSHVSSKQEANPFQLKQAWLDSPY